MVACVSACVAGDGGRLKSLTDSDLKRIGHAIEKYRFILSEFLSLKGFLLLLFIPSLSSRHRHLPLLRTLRPFRGHHLPFFTDFRQPRGRLRQPWGRRVP